MFAFVVETVVLAFAGRGSSFGGQEAEGGYRNNGGTALGSVACCLPLGSKLDQRRKIHAQPSQCRPLSPDRIGTVNHFGNSFQLIKILPDRDC